MDKWVLKPVSITTEAVVAISQDRRFLALESGTAFDTKTRPVLSILNEREIKGVLVSLPFGIRILMDENTFGELFTLLESDFDIEEVKDSVAGCDFVNSGSVTICVLTDKSGGKFVGSFNAIAAIGMSEEECQELAYADAFHQLVQFEINTRIRLLPA